MQKDLFCDGLRVGMQIVVGHDGRGNYKYMAYTETQPPLNDVDEMVLPGMKLRLPSVLTAEFLELFNKDLAPLNVEIEVVADRGESHLRFTFGDLCIVLSKRALCQSCQVFVVVQ